MRMNPERRVCTRTETLEHICTRQQALRIPCYQRPYVWSADDVQKLLDDICNAMCDGQPHYYIGTLISADVTQAAGVADEVGAAAHCVLDLIDGQQRTTTLMLIALAFRQLGIEHPLVHMPVLGRQPRLTFPIRDAVQTLLAHHAGLGNAEGLDVQVLDSEYVQGLERGLRAARQKLQQLQAPSQAAGRPGVDLMALATFIYQQVIWVNNTIAPSMSPSSLFTRVNTGGVQLEHSDILKAQLLQKIAPASKPYYDAIWQACENLNNFFERNVRALFPLAQWEALQWPDLAQFSPEKFPLPAAQVHATSGLTLAQLWADARLAPAKGSGGPATSASSKSHADGVQGTDYCRSIIGFPLLLLHTLRIFYAQTGQADVRCRVHAAHLGEAFKDFVRTAQEAQVRAFVECLWRVRYQFDRWIAKWRALDGDKEEHLYLEQVYVSTSGNQRRLSRSGSEACKDLVQLQAVRNFTGERSAQYWIGPFLYAMMGQPDAGFADALAVLERIDNVLSLAQPTQKEASCALLCGQSVPCDDWSAVDAYLHGQLGTGFGHYWFQKLEYVLWRNREGQAHFLQPKRWEKFRISSKNSVEHVYPQQHEYAQRQGRERPVWVDGFANLALLSPGENSSYSNQDPAKKRVDFESKTTYDALKLAHIFHLMGADGDWNTEQVRVHEQTMLALLQAHYMATPVQGDAPAGSAGKVAA